MTYEPPNGNDKPPRWYPQVSPKSAVKRDEKGRIEKGNSGNPKGRPPKKAVPFGARALMRDFVAESERIIDINGEELPIMRLLLRQLLTDAVKGDHRAQQRVFDLHEKAIGSLEHFNRRANSDLAALEQYIIDLDLESDPMVQRQLNELRKRAKQI